MHFPKHVIRHIVPAQRPVLLVKRPSLVPCRQCLLELEEVLHMIAEEWGSMEQEQGVTRKGRAGQGAGMADGLHIILFPLLSSIKGSLDLHHADVDPSSPIEATGPLYQGKGMKVPLPQGNLQQP